MLDEVPETAAMRFATLALDGPLADDARARLVDNVHPAVANLAVSTSTPWSHKRPRRTSSRTDPSAFHWEGKRLLRAMPASG